MKNGLVRKVGKMLTIPILALSLSSVGLASPKKAEAKEGFSIGAQAEYIMPSDQAMKDIYGNMFGIGGKVGYQTRDNFRVGIKAGFSFATGTPYLLGDSSDISATSSIRDLSVQARVAKAFDLGKVTPYLGVEGSYDSIKEVLELSDIYGDTASASAKTSEFGYGIFGGIEIPTSVKVTPYMEILINSIPIKDSGGASENLGGVSIAAGAKYQF